MKIETFSQHYDLAQAGKLKFLACPKHKEDEEMFGVKYHLYARQEDNKIMLYCNSCGYEQTVGLQLYENILREISNA